MAEAGETGSFRSCVRPGRRRSVRPARSVSDRASFGHKLRKRRWRSGPRSRPRGRRLRPAPRKPIAAVADEPAVGRRVRAPRPGQSGCGRSACFLCVTGGHLGMTQGSATVAGYRARGASTTPRATVSPRPGGEGRCRRGGPRLAVGAAAFGVARAGYIIFALTSPSHQWMDPVDLRVYTDGGLIVRHVRPFYRAFRAAPLYDWPGYAHLPFTYSPFAAMVFTAGSVVSFKTLAQISVGVNLAAMLGCVWMTLGGLGCRRGLARLGATLLLAAPVLWTQPIQRTLFLGQSASARRS